jgi:hypothetical protein
VSGVDARSATPATPQRSLLPRALLASVAFLLAAWFGVLARDHEIGTAASVRMGDPSGMSEAEWRRSMADLDRAQLLNPSSDWKTLKAHYLLYRDKPEALRLALSIVRREPDNLAAWMAVLRASSDLDPRRHRQALAQTRRLNPTPPAR